MNGCGSFLSVVADFVGSFIIGMFGGVGGCPGLIRVVGGDAIRDLPVVVESVFGGVGRCPRLGRVFGRCVGR